MSTSRSSDTSTLPQASRGRKNHLELPSFEEIERIDQERSMATESLEISDTHVKCQGCGSLRPLLTDESKLIDSSGLSKVSIISIYFLYKKWVSLKI